MIKSSVNAQSYMISELDETLISIGRSPEGIKQIALLLLIIRGLAGGGLVVLDGVLISDYGCWDIFNFADGWGIPNELSELFLSDFPATMDVLDDQPPSPGH